MGCRRPGEATWTHEGEHHGQTLGGRGSLLARQRFVYKGLIPSAALPNDPCLATFTPGITPVSPELPVANVPNDEPSDVVGTRL